MIRKPRSQARTGGIACPCCRSTRKGVPNRTLRTREARAWKREAV